MKTRTTVKEKKREGGETISKFSFTGCLANFFPFLVVLKKLIMFSCNFSLYLINCLGLGYENFQRRIRDIRIKCLIFIEFT